MKRLIGSIAVCLLTAACGGGATPPPGGGEAVPEVVAPPNPVKASLADVARVTASSEKKESTEATGSFARNAADGDRATRWESEWKTDPAWIVVEFREKRVVESLRIVWEFAAAAVYQIEASDDGTTWTKVKRIEDGQSKEERLVRLDQPVTTKFIRITGERRTSDEFGYSIHEIELNPAELFADDEIRIIGAEATSVQTAEVPEGTDFSARSAIDGNLETRWSSVNGDPQSITVELESPARVRALKIKWESAAARTYAVQVSTDKTTWRDVAKVDRGAAAEERVVNFEAAEAKFVRIQCTARLEGSSPNWGYSIFEIKAYR